jgi:hypothetical protein
MYGGVGGRLLTRAEQKARVKAAIATKVAYGQSWAVISTGNAFDICDFLSVYQQLFRIYLNRLMLCVCY